MAKSLTAEGTVDRLDDEKIMSETATESVATYPPEHILSHLTVLERKKNTLFYQILGKRTRVIMDAVDCPSKLTTEARLAWFGSTFYRLDKVTSVQLQVGHLSFDKGDTYWRWLEYLLPYCTGEPELYALAAAKTRHKIKQRADAKVKFLVELLWDPPTEEIAQLIPFGIIIKRTKKSSSKKRK